MTEPSNNINYSLADIERYLQGKMNANEMHALEKAALQDPFLADAIEGFSETDLSVAKTHLTSIRTAVLQEQKEETKVIPMQAERKNWLRIAASVIGIIGIAGISFYVLNKQKGNQELASNTNKAAEISNVPSSNPSLLTDSVKNSTAKIETPKNVEPSVIGKGDVDQNQATISNDANAPTQWNGGKDNAVASSPVAAMKEDEKEEKLTEITTQERKASIEKWKAEQEKAAMVNKPANSNKQLQGNANGLNTSNELRGRVMNRQGEPVGNATINANVRNQRFSINSDANGFFTVPAYDTTAVASVSSFGYQQQNLNLSANRSNNIVLDENKKQEEEITVVGYGSSKKKTSETATTTARPEGGWQTFYDYVALKLSKEDSIQLYSGQEIDIEFSVDKKGRPNDIKPVEYENERAANKAVELLKNGPNWITEKKNKKAKVTIRL